MHINFRGHAEPVPAVVSPLLLKTSKRALEGSSKWTTSGEKVGIRASRLRSILRLCVLKKFSALFFFSFFLSHFALQSYYIFEPLSFFVFSFTAQYNRRFRNTRTSFARSSTRRDFNPKTTFTIRIQRTFIASRSD